MLFQVITIIFTTPIAKLIVAFLSGLLPVLVWLWFLEHEDKHPEPKRLILLAFFAGMLAVVCVIPFEEYTAKRGWSVALTVLLWSAIEEIAKYVVAYITVLRRIENDEPIDGMMYLIATALGFAALENAFFILRPILDGDTVRAIITGDFRFIGATLLHVIASSAIGACLALSYYRTKSTRRLYTGIGLILAIVLHALFNLSIIISDGGRAVYSFYGVWLVLVGILLLFEKVKTIKN